MRRKEDILFSSSSNCYTDKKIDDEEKKIKKVQNQIVHGVKTWIRAKKHRMKRDQ